MLHSVIFKKVFVGTQKRASWSVSNVAARADISPRKASFGTVVLSQHLQTPLDADAHAV
jgi:hypothetical protein